MNKEYIFSEKEYAALIGISKEALRSRRREGKLKGEYIQKEDKRYFYCRPEKTEKKETKFKRRGVHKSGGQTNYPNEAFKKHNEKKRFNFNYNQFITYNFCNRMDYTYSRSVCKFV